MTDRQELDDLLTAVLDRQVAANPVLATDFGSVFGADAADTAAQWIVHYLLQYTADIEALTATNQDPGATADTAADPASPPDPATVELLADVRTILDEAVTAVPEAGLLSQEEIDQVLLEALGEDVE